MQTADTEDVFEALRAVVDPELGVNVVDLGLVYGVTLGGDGVATTGVTLTSAACPLTDVIEERAASALEGLVTDFRITWVWLPRGGRTRSPQTAAGNSAAWASTSDRPGRPRLDTMTVGPR